VDHFKPLPNGDCGDGVLNPYPKDQVPDKYWSQRRRLFTLFDKGIQLDKESWYSVTPEAIAKHIASHLVGSMEDAVVLDPLCGCGGNSIAFALRKNVKRVVCVDVDVEKLKKAHWNASIYGVQEKLLLIHANAGNVLSRYNGGKLITSTQEENQSESQICLPSAIDAIFLSPPWGGVDYGDVGRHGYDLTCIKVVANDGTECDGEWLLEKAIKALGDKNIACFLPKNINGVALAKSAFRVGCRTPIVLEQNVLNGKLKTVTAYLGLGT
jgi:trimethylguanosine synthase